MYFVVFMDSQELGPRKHWHTHHWNLGEKPGSKKVSPDRCFPRAGLDRRKRRCKHSVALFQRYYRDTSTWNPLESSYFKATEPFNVSYVDLSEYSVSVQYTISRYHFLNRLGPGAEARNSERSQFARRIISCLFFSGKNSEYCFVSVTN